MRPIPAPDFQDNDVLNVPVARCAGIAKALRMLAGITDAPAAVAAMRKKSRRAFFNVYHFRLER
jgi:hypothetical protein